MDAHEVLGYSIPVIETEEDWIAATAAGDQSMNWYLNRRAVALVAATKFDPLKHPRGHDGRFISIGAFVKFFADGVWQRGTVDSIDEDGVTVKDKYSVEHLVHDPTKNIYTLPTPKATLPLPDLGKTHDKGFTKIGGQGGSNPGALFQKDIIGTDVGQLGQVVAHVPYDLMDNIYATAQKEHLKIKASDGPNGEPDGSITFSMDVGYDLDPSEGTPEGDMNGFDLKTKSGLLNGQPVAWLDKSTVRYPGASYAGDSVDVAHITADEVAAWYEEMGFKFYKAPAGKPPFNVDDVKPLPNPGPVPSPTEVIGPEKFYVKKCKSKDHAANEVLAATLYSLAGVPMPVLAKDPDGITISSQIIDGSKPLNAANADELSKLREDLPIDAWLANWDTVGLSLDNVVISPDGTPFRIDTGGALLYRAQGSPKGAAFGPKVGELKTLRDPKMNAQSAKIFAKATPEELKSGRDRLAAVSDQDIKDAVADAGFGNDLAEKLIYRRDNVLVQLDTELLSKAGAPTPAPPAPTAKDLTATIYGDPVADPTLSKDLGPAWSHPVSDVWIYGDVGSSKSAQVTAKDDGTFVVQWPTGITSLFGSFDDAVENIEGLFVDTPTAPPLTPSMPPTSTPDTAMGGTPTAPFFIATGDSFDIPPYSSSEETKKLQARAQAGEEIWIIDGSGTVGKVLPVSSQILQVETKNGLKSRVSGICTQIEPPDPFHMEGQPVSFKKDGTLSYGGKLVGAWSKPPYGYSYTVMINPAYTANGKQFKTSIQKKKDAATAVMLRTFMPPTPSPVSPKKPEALAVEHAVISATDGVAGHVVLSDGSVPTKDLEVDHVDGGWSGKVSGAPDQAKYPGLLYVKPDGGGKTKIVKNTKLKSKVDLVALAEAAYTGKKTKDGKIPAVGMHVKTGKLGMTGTIVKIDESKGWIHVQPDDGSKKKITTLGTTTVLGGASSTGAHAAIASTPAAPPSVLSGPAAELKKVLPKQDPIDVTNWTKSHKLMKDGTVPYAGLDVLDKTGAHMTIVQTYPSWKSTPNAVKVYDKANDKIVTRQVATLSVDWDSPTLTVPTVNHMSITVHPSAYTDIGAGDGVAKAVDFVIPDGAMLYKVKNRASYPVWYIVKPTNGGDYDIQRVNATDKLHNASSQNIAEGLLGNKYGQMAELVARGDSKSDLVLVGSSGTLQTGTKDPTTHIHSIVPDAEVKAAAAKGTTVTALEHKKAEKQGALPTAVSVGTALPSPPVKSKASDKSTMPKVDDAGGQFATTVLPDGRTIDQSIKQVLTKRNKKDPGSGVDYALTDSGTIEDMMVRFQIVTKSDGTEALEARFKLNQTAADSLGDQMLTGKGGHYGAWNAGSANVKDLASGTKLRLRTSSSSGVLKPGTDMTGEPNATVTGPPVLISPKTTAGGFDTYRVPIVNAQGEPGEVDVQDRGTASLRTFAWNSDEFVPAAAGNLKLSAAAVNDGWTRQGNSGLVSTEQYPDPTGKKIYKAGDHSINTGPANGGSKYTRPIDGGQVSINYANKKESNNHVGGARSGNLDKEVIIQVPIDKTIKSSDVEHTLSQGLQAVGVSADIQRPPNKDELHHLAISKLASLFADNKNMKWTPGVPQAATGYPGDPATDQILGTISQQLGIPVTMDDAILFTEPDGRSWVGLSDRVSDALTQKKKVGFYHHSMSGGRAQLLEVLSSPNNGLLSTDERYSRGLLVTGASSDTDMRNGAGDRLYLTSKSPGAGAPSHGTGIIMSGRAVARTTEVYAGTGGDGYGKRGSTPWAASGAIYENMYKRAISPSMIAYAYVNSAQDRQWVIDELHKRGVKTLAGRKVEDFVVTPNMVNGKLKGPSFQALGSTDLEGIKIEELK